MQKTSHKRRTLASNVYGWHVHDVHMIHLSLCRSCCRETQAREGRKKENGEEVEEDAFQEDEYPPDVDAEEIEEEWPEDEEPPAKRVK